MTLICPECFSPNVHGASDMRLDAAGALECGDCGCCGMDDDFESSPSSLGFSCPHCGSTDVLDAEDEGRYPGALQCAGCGASGLDDDFTLA